MKTCGPSPSASVHVLNCSAELQPPPFRGNAAHATTGNFDCEKKITCCLHRLSSACGISFVLYVFGLCTLAGSKTKNTKLLPQADERRCMQGLRSGRTLKRPAQNNGTCQLKLHGRKVCRRPLDSLSLPPPPARQILRIFEKGTNFAKCMQFMDGPFKCLKSAILTSSLKGALEAFI